MITWYSAVSFHIMKVRVAFMDRETVIKEPMPDVAARAAVEGGCGWRNTDR